MQSVWYKTDAPKQTTHLSINGDLLRQAKELKINLSQTLERHLEAQLMEARRQKWLEDSREAIDEYADFVGKHGCFADKLRSF